MNTRFALTCLSIFYFLLSTAQEVTFDLKEINYSVRALEGIDEKTAWFAGSSGVYGYTEDGGQTWTIDSIEYNDIKPEFRSISVTKEAVHILSVGTPALLFRSTDKGVNWSLVYTEDNPSTFYDAMDFEDNNYGMAVGDPVDGCMSIIKTTDGGKSWTKIPCSKLPAAKEGEGCFAASDTNIILYKNKVWFVTGGPVARVHHSNDRGSKWEVYETPIVQGEQMTGIFSGDFHNNKKGIIVGGDWMNKDSNIGNIAVTEDGGKSWNLVSEGMGPGYRSCVQYIDKKGNELIAVGSPGISYSKDGGINWTFLSDQPLYTFRSIVGEKFAWVAGNKIIGFMEW